MNDTALYDNPEFFAGYAALRRNDSGLNGALEEPALRHRLPDVGGARILDLGCGTGVFARWARNAGAVAVTAVDVSARMLDEARAATDDPAIEYVHASIEEVSMGEGAFDLVVSSLALHYVADFANVARRVFTALRSGGRFVFSVEHPIRTANPIGWVRDPADGRALHWPLDRYFDEGRRDTRWFVDGVVKYHRTTAGHVNTLLAEGFRLDALDEPTLPEGSPARDRLWGETRCPAILVVAASR